MDPATGLTILGTAVGSAKVLERMLGPTADYLGGGMRIWTEKSCQNLGRIFQRAKDRLGDRINQPGTIPPRVLKEILEEGSFCEDVLWAEYFGGVLASSRSSASRDDRGATHAALLGRLSTYQVRAHYLLYRYIKTLFDGGTHSVNTDAGRHALRLFVPINAFVAGMDLSQGEREGPILGHTITGLVTEDLLAADYKFGDKRFLMENGFPDAPGDGIVVGPSVHGTELFLWAHGMGNVETGRFLSSEVELQSDVGINLSPGARGIERDGPVLDTGLKVRRLETPETK